MTDTTFTTFGNNPSADRDLPANVVNVVSGEVAVQARVAHTGAARPVDDRGGGGRLACLDGGYGEQACVGELLLGGPVVAGEAQGARRVAVDGEGEHGFFAQVHAIVSRGGGRDALAHGGGEARGVGALDA